MDAQRAVACCEDEILSLCVITWCRFSQWKRENKVFLGAPWRGDVACRLGLSFDEKGSFLVILARSGSSSNGSLLRLLRWKARMSKHRRIPYF